MKTHTFEGRVIVEPISPILWKTHEDIIVRGDRETFVVPAGYETDFATVPRIAVWLIPRFGSYTIAAIFHDWLLTHAIPAGIVTSVDADNLFRRALRDLGVPPYRRNLMWTGVRWAAAFSRRRSAGWWSTAPAVFGWSALFLASLVPPVAMIVVALALVVHGAIETFFSTFSKKDETTSGSLST
jgi:hypothetical protein